MAISMKNTRGGLKMDKIKQYKAILNYLGPQWMEKKEKELKRLMKAGAGSEST